MSNQSALRLYRVGRKGRSTFLGNFVSVATGLLPEVALNAPNRRGVHIQIKDGPDQRIDHTLRGEPSAAEALILKLALAIHEARAISDRTPNIFGKAEAERSATIGVLMGIIDKLSTPAVDQAAAYQRIAAE